MIRIVDHGEANEAPYLVMEWVDGETLQSRLDRAGPLAPKDAATLVAKLARAVAHCHAAGIVHRDLKPPNVLLRGWDQEPLLTDFGLAKDLEATLATMATREGLSLGTPGWWSPEQARGEIAKLGPPTDVWGLGALLFATLTGEPPLRGETLVEHLRAIERGPRSLRELRPDVPQELEAITARCFERDPLRRPAAAAVAAALEGWVRRTGPGSPALLVALALIVAGVAASVLVFVWPRERAPSPRPTLVPEAPAPLETRAEPPSAARTWLASAIEKRRMNDYPGARVDYDRALELDPRMVEALVDRGTLSWGENDLAAALADYERALAVDPRHVAARRNRGAVLSARGDIEGALAELDLALEIAPGDGSVWSERAVVRFVKGDLTGARSDLDEAIRLDPAQAKPWHDRGVLRLRQGDRAGAITDLERARDLARDPQLARDVQEALEALARQGG